MTEPTTRAGDELLTEIIQSHEAPSYHVIETIRTAIPIIEAEATAAAEQRQSPYTERSEHERESSTGGHLFDAQCPFCFFDHFTPEARAECASWPPSMPTPASPRQGEPVDKWTAEGLEPFTPKNETGLMLGVAIGALFQSGRNEAHLASCPVARDVIWIIGRRRAALSEPAEAGEP